MQTEKEEAKIQLSDGSSSRSHHSHSSHHRHEDDADRYRKRKFSSMKIKRFIGKFIFFGLCFFLIVLVIMLIWGYINDVPEYVNEYKPKYSL